MDLGVRHVEFQSARTLIGPTGPFSVPTLFQLSRTNLHIIDILRHETFTFSPACVFTT